MIDQIHNQAMYIVIPLKDYLAADESEDGDQAHEKMITDVSDYRSVLMFHTS